MANGEFKLGDWVTWQSQSQGYWSSKTGQVVGHVPAYIPFKDGIIINTEEFTTSISKMTLPLFRDHLSYIVAVPQGPKAKRKIYWPNVQNLRKPVEQP